MLVPAQAILWALLNSLWQSAIIWLGYKMFKSSITPTQRKQFLLLGIILQLFTTLLFVFKSNSAIHTLSLAPLQNNLFFEKWIVGVYFLILFIKVKKSILSEYQLKTTVKGITRASADVRIFINTHRAILGIKKNVAVFVTQKNIVPYTKGFLKPIIVLPIALLNRMSTSQVEAILLHELTHIKNRDYLFNYLVVAAEHIFYFNPFLKALINEFKTEREKCCDEMVLNFGYDLEEYCLALYETAKGNFHNILLPAITFVNKNNDLLARMQSMLSEYPYKKRGNSWLAIYILMGALFLAGSVNVKQTEKKVTSIRKEEKTETITTETYNDRVINTSPVVKTASKEKPVEVIATKASSIKKEIENNKLPNPKILTENYTDPELIQTVSINENNIEKILIIEETSAGKKVRSIVRIKLVDGKPSPEPILLQTITTDSTGIVADSVLSF